MVGAGAVWLWSGWKGEQPAILQIRNLGGSVYFKPVGRIGVRQVLERLFPEWRLRVDQVWIPRTTADEIEKLDLGSLRRLRTLDVNEVQLTPAVLSKVGAIKDLDVLLLAYTSLDTAGMEQLRELTNLSFLDVHSTTIDDGALVYVAKFKRLHRLDLGSTRITDAGLEHLKGLASLELLNLSGTSVTPEGVRKLRVALPGTTIFDAN
jgi:hypothetical protein